VFHSTYKVKDRNGKDSVVIRKIGEFYEEVFIPLGISVAIKNSDFVNTQALVQQFWYSKILPKYLNNEYKAKHLFCQSEKIDIPKDIVFANNGVPWITGLRGDVVKSLPSNWIRAGDFNLGVWDSGNSVTHSIRKYYYEWRLEDAFFSTDLIIDNKGTASGLNSDRAYKDISGKFRSVCGGTWAPYVLTSPFDFCPQANLITPERNVFTYPIGNASYHIPFCYRFQGLIDISDQPGYNQTMTNLYSVNVVITPDQSLWSRCVVLESCGDSTRSEGKVWKNEPRKALSVGKNGKPDGSTDGFYEDGKYGMSWFPGYAINIETGERLNIMFSENSDTLLNNKYSHLVKGNDMVFNPTSTYAIATQNMTFEYEDFYFAVHEGQVLSKQLYDALYLFFDNGTQYLRNCGVERVWGGMHYVYVCGSSGNTSPAYFLSSWDGKTEPRRNFNLNDTIFKMQPIPQTPEQTWGGYLDAPNNQYPAYDCGPYDESKWLVKKFKEILNADDTFITSAVAHVLSMRKKAKMQLFNNVMYTHIPMLPEDPDLQKEWMSCDVTYKIRVTRPYLRYTSRWFETPEEKDYSVPAEYAHQRGFPTYKISFKELAPTYNDTRVYQEILDKINIVPNPYYGGSLYEKNALENMVKITNLPTDLKNGAPVTINIYTVSGILVRTLTKGDSETTYVNWDLKNYANIPIAGGVYIIHVNCPGIGERMLKFFCTMRAADLNTF
jgi:hypothetical protein